MLITAVCEVCGKPEGECIGGRCVECGLRFMLDYERAVIKKCYEDLKALRDRPNGIGDGDIQALFTERNALREEVKHLKYELTLAQEELEDDANWKDNIRKEEEAVRDSNNAWMKLVLGPMWSQLWGPELEALGRGVDFMRARMDRAEEQARLLHKTIVDRCDGRNPEICQLEEHFHAFKTTQPSAGGYCGLHNYGFVGVHCPHCVGEGK